MKVRYDNTSRVVLITAVVVLTVAALSVGGAAATSGGEQTTVNESENSTTAAIEFSTDWSSQIGNDTHITAHPATDVEGTPTFNETTTFEIENRDTGESVTVSLAAGQPEVQLHTAVLFRIYDVNGEIADNPRIFVPDDSENDDDNFVAREVSITGDKSTFTQGRDTYQITLVQNGERVDTTSTHELTIGHEKRFEQSITEDEIQFSFAVGDLPTDGKLRGGIRTEGGERVPAESVTYDSNNDIFVATVDRANVPAGEHLGFIQVDDSDTEFIEIRLINQVTVEEDSTEPEGMTVSVVPQSEEVLVGSSTEVDIVLSGADNGVSAYDIDVPVSGPGQFTEFEQTQQPQFNSSEIQDGGATLHLEAGMGDNVYDPAEEVVIVTATIDATEPGTLTVEPTGSEVSDLDLAQYEVVEQAGAEVEVLEEPPGPGPIVGDQPPQDLDGDGNFEDIDGDGELTIFDVQTLFSSLDEEAVQNNPEAFNFAGDENPTDVTIFDVQGLFGQI